MSRTKANFYLIIIVFFISCEGEVGPQGIGLNSLTNVTNEPNGSNCESGGVKIEVGTDNNENGALDTDEVLSTSYVCNGTDGATSLTVATTEPAGTNCENGGVKISSGVDFNDDGTLDDTEISATAYVCNGNDGNNSLTKISNEASGTNCENGGLKIDWGTDINGDGTLDDSEILTTAYVCNGTDGDVNLVNISDEVPGANCTNGGVKIDSGIDSDGDGILDDAEIQISRFICNGANGDGFDEQIRIRIELPGVEFFGDNLGYKTTSSSYDFAGSGLIDFNKNYFVGVDSILLSSNPWNWDGIITYIELYNSTDGVSISNSEIQSTASRSSRTYIQSQNIFDQLPDYTVDLGIRIKSENGSSEVWSGQPYLFLYRSN